MKDLRYLHEVNKTEIPENKKGTVEKFRKKGEEFNEKYKYLSEDKDEYDKFRKKSNTNKWSVFKKVFLKLTDYKCPICEKAVDKYDDIDHYRPKNHYWWLAYDYKNYMVYCELCNRAYKKELFPLFIDNQINNETKNLTTFDNRIELDKEKSLIFNPNFDNPNKLFEIEFVAQTDIRAGVVKIKPQKKLDKNTYLHAKAKTTIKLFNLNNDNNEIEEADKDFRQINMETNFKDLINLAKRKNKLKEESTLQNMKFYKNEQKILNKEKAKNGLQKLIENGNFEIPNFI